LTQEIAEPVHEQLDDERAGFNPIQAVAPLDGDEQAMFNMGRLPDLR
jgi:hypothetical protein